MKESVVKEVKRALKEINADLKKEEIENLIEVPSSSEMGDYAFPCFALSRLLKRSPDEIASDLGNKIISSAGKDFEKVKAVGPYLNFFINRKNAAFNLLKQIIKEKDKFGCPERKKKRKIMVEFSQANSHKAFHVGHIRGTSLGESVARILEFTGNEVTRANYQGDTGMHVAKWLWCYVKHHKDEEIKDDESWFASVYVDAVRRLGEDKSLQEEVNEINRKLSDGDDEELISLWKKTRELSLKSFEKIYGELNTRFDCSFFESEMEKEGKKIINSLLEKRIAKESEGAVIMDLKKHNLGIWVLLRKDGTILYSGKDLALAEKKFRDFGIDESIYFACSDQKLHFEQLFKTLELTGFAHDLRAVHYSQVRLPTGKMSSRTGDNVLYSDFMKEMTCKAREQVRDREPKITDGELEKRALEISVAAIKYSMLKHGPGRDMIFNLKESLNFEGDTGPYILYSYARANSILGKHGREKEDGDFRKLESSEFELVRKLSAFPDAVLKSAESLNPSIIAHYSYQLAQTFNEFYHACPVINSEKESFRILLVRSFIQVLKNSMNLLGINLIERM